MMQTMPYKLQEKGVVEVAQIPSKWKSHHHHHHQQQQQQEQQQQQQLPVYSNFTTTGTNNNKNNNNNNNISSNNNNNNNNNNNSCSRTSGVESDPASASASTLSSSFTDGGGGGGGSGVNCISAGVADPTCPQVGGGGGGGGIGLEEWDSLFPNGDGALLPWIMGDPGDPDDNDPGSGMKHLLQSGNNPTSVMGTHFEGNAGLGVVDQVCCSDGGVVPITGFNLNPTQLQFPTQLLNPHLVINQQQTHPISNPSFLISPPLAGNSSSNNNNNSYCQQFDPFQPNPKRHNPGLILDPFLDPRQQCHIGGGGLTRVSSGLGLGQGMVVGVKEQLYKAADMIQSGNFSLAQEILARLNQQFLSVQGKPPLVRAAMHLKEALQMLLQLSNPVSVPPPKTLTPYDIVHKMNAYKVFSEVSPITQFVNFTSTQAILEAVDGHDDDVSDIHIVDFDIGCGAQWASLIQELPLRKRGAPAPALHITSVVSPTTHPFELSLVRENLVQFANDTGIAFELQIVNLDSFDPSLSSFPEFSTSDNECFAVNIPIWASSTKPSLLPSILRFIKQHSPKIVVCFDRGFDRCDLPFPQHLIHTLESCINLLESLDGLNVAPDLVNKVEKFFVQPGIENSVLGRLHAPDKMPHWKNLFTSAGFVPLQFSNFTETQADYIVKRTPGRGFHVEKRQASLVLSWQRRELVAASAWRC